MMYDSDSCGNYNYCVLNGEVCENKGHDCYTNEDYNSCPTNSCLWEDEYCQSKLPNHDSECHNLNDDSCTADDNCVWAELSYPEKMCKTIVN